MTASAAEPPSSCKVQATELGRKPTAAVRASSNPRSHQKLMLFDLSKLFLQSLLGCQLYEKRPLNLAGVFSGAYRNGGYSMSVIPACFAAFTSKVKVCSQPTEEAVRSIKQSAKSALPVSKILKARIT